MDLHRRKLWWDRLTWLLVVGATVVIVLQYVRRGGVFQRYLLYGWSAVVVLLFLSELRVGRRHPRPSARALFAGWAKFVGEERVDAQGDRQRGWQGTASGVLEFVPAGVHWAAKANQGGPEEILIPWTELHGWKVNGVVPLVWRASGYLTMTTTTGRELVFHVQGLRRWRRALREAAIVGPTFVRPEWLPEDAAPELPYLLAEALAPATDEARAPGTVEAEAMEAAPEPERPAAAAEEPEAVAASGEVAQAGVLEPEEPEPLDGILEEAERADAAGEGATPVAAAGPPASPRPAERPADVSVTGDSAELADALAVLEEAPAEWAVDETSPPDTGGPSGKEDIVEPPAATASAAASAEPEAASAPEAAHAARASGAEATVASIEQPTLVAEAGREAGVDLEPVIGLECHVELSTRSKVFCGCPTEFGAPPNTQVCPVCSGQPGTLPVLNERAVEFALRIALALNCRVAPESVFHRKNYFYPDMPKNYQISQYDIPLATDGFLEFEAEGVTTRVGIHRVHLEEDPGKTTHVGGGGRIGDAEYAKVDYNRAGVPLVEIVSEPEIGTPEEARAYLAELRALLQTLGVSDVRMEQGSLRCDANVSVRPRGSSGLGVKAEVKNMNSMRSVQRALEFEIERQGELVAGGTPVVQETRHFDEATGRTIAGRSKEYSADYRYFPDPDLVPLAPDRAWLEQIRSTLPELPAQRRRRFVDQLGLTAVESRTLTSSKALADAFEAAVGRYEGEPRAIARWYTGELAALANERGVEPHEVGIAPEQVAELQVLVDSGRVSISLAKGRVLREMVSSGRSANAVVHEAGLAQISDEDSLVPVVDEVIAAHPDVVEKIRSGKASAVNVLKGQIMRRTKGRANPALVDDLLKHRLGAP